MIVRRPAGRKQSLTKEQREKLQANTHIFSVEEWAELYGCTVNTIRNMIKEKSPVQIKLEELREQEEMAVKKRRLDRIKKDKIERNIK